MQPTTPPAPAERFAGIIDGLCRAVAARSFGRALAGPLIVLLWSRLRRLAARFAGLAARIQAGTLPAARCRPASPRPGGPPPTRLPRGSAWLVRLVPEAACYGSQLQHLLADPEMAALVAAAPQMGRILRPLCRMLGVRPPPGLLPSPAAPSPPTRGPSPSRPAASGRTPPAASHPARPPQPPRPAPASAPMACPRACGPPVSA